jgi:PAS domain S-box-containing protein
MNPVAEVLTGWPQAEAAGQDLAQVFQIIHQGTRRRAEDPATRVIRERVVVGLDDDILLVARNGKEIPIDDSAAPIRDEHGRLTGVVIVFRDVSERVWAAQALGQYALELQARNEDLDAFAHSVAHDLKAPLNPIIGFAQMLLEGYSTLPPRQVHEYLDVIVRSGRKMSNIIEELLLLAQVQTKDIKTRPLKMGEVVAEVQQRLTYMIEEYQAQIILPTSWPTALGYAPWVEEVWANYLSNGLKYGGQPPRLELGADVLAEGMIRFWVRDNGPGLTSEEQARLFAPFTQLSQVRATGHGLGLSIVRRIVEKLGGRAGVESQPGQGSTFSFTLPPSQEP